MCHSAFYQAGTGGNDKCLYLYMILSCLFIKFKFIFIISYFTKIFVYKMSNDLVMSNSLYKALNVFLHA